MFADRSGHLHFFFCALFPGITTSLAEVIRALRGPKSKKSRKKFPGASRPRGQKRLKKSKKRSKTSPKTTFFFFRLSQPFFRLFFDLF